MLVWSLRGGSLVVGDWIKMRSKLSEDPAVILTSSLLDIPETHVVGLLHKLWSWADAQLENGDALGVTPSWIDRYVGVTGFTNCLQQSGWLLVTDDGITLPNFDRHMGQSAKKRALAAVRKQVQRSKESHAASVTNLGRERDQRREEKNRNNNTPKPPRGFVDWWSCYPVKEGSKPKALLYWMGKKPLADGKRHNCEPHAEQIIRNLKAQIAAKDALKVAGQFCPRFKNADSYIYNQRWRDEISAPDTKPTAPTCECGCKLTTDEGQATGVCGRCREAKREKVT